jgi:NADPH:quinone reductase
LDTVAGDLFPRCVAALRPGGTLSLVGATGGHDVRLNVWSLMQPVTLTGYSSESLDGDSLRRAIAALSGWLARGVLTPPARRLIPLGEAAAAHALLERRGVEGRLLLCADVTR